MIPDFFPHFLRIAAVYFLVINLIYALLMLLSWIKIRKFYQNQKKAPEIGELPSVSFIIPAFNEETLIVETLQTYLNLPLKNKEIITINDGSQDQTFRMLQTMFQLKRQSEDSKVFISIPYPDLKVIEAAHLGKAEALNLGVSHSRFELICTMDADTIPSPQGMVDCLKEFARNPKLDAAGGVIQILHPGPPEKFHWVTAFQRIEYLRTFLCERPGWSFLNSTILISGAFCMVKKSILKSVSGFKESSITEDFDLIVRIREAYPGKDHEVKVLPLLTCSTQVPKSMKHLMVQRIRWQMGLVQTLGEHLNLFLNPKYKFLGLITLPYFWLVEVFSPVCETLALFLIPLAIYHHWLSPEIVLFFVALSLLFNILLTVMGVYLDTKYVSQKKTHFYLSSIIDTTLMHFGFKQILSFWRLVAIFKSFGKSKSWGQKPRQEITHHP